MMHVLPLSMEIHASGGAEDAFSKAFAEYKDGIFRHCYFIVFDRELALEIMQETFMKTWEYIAAGHDLENVRAFLYKVATNLSFNAKKKKSSSSLDKLQEEGFDPPSEDEALQKDFVAEAEVLRVLQKIDEPYRTAVSLRYIEGLTPAEIAQITQASPTNVSVRIHRGLKELRSLLNHG